MGYRVNEPDCTANHAGNSLMTLLMIAVLAAMVAYSCGCTRITLPNGITYTNFAQDKSYSVTYTDPESGDVLKADINVKNDPLIRALDTVNNLAEKVPAP